LWSGAEFSYQNDICGDLDSVVRVTNDHKLLNIITVFSLKVNYENYVINI